MEILSYCFRDGDGHVIKSLNENLNMNPASNMKIISGYAVYKILGRGFNFKTRFIYKRNVLFVSGDPSFLMCYEDLKKVIKKLYYEGDIQDIEFSHIFDQEIYRKSWEIEDMSNCYGAPVFPYTVNEGCITDSGLPFNSHTERGIPINKIRQVILDLSIDRSQNRGITSNIAYYNSSIEDILRHIMVYSCNYNIELLTKYLSYMIDGIGTWNRSNGIIKKFLNDFYGENDVNIDDGSGLSVKNLVTTEFMSNFIRKINDTNPEFLRFLPAPGEGTLAKRFHNVKNFGIYAKTGTLFGTSFLSGISEAKGISFSIGINNSISAENEREKLIDDILIETLESL